MKFITKIFLPIFLYLLPFLGFTQKLTNIEKQNIQIYPGYIVTANHNDTIYGKIKFLNPVSNEDEVVFFKDDNKTTYYPAQGIISEYGFQYRQYNKETDTIEPLWFVYIRKLIPKSNSSIGSIEAFVEREINGEFTLYNYFTLETTKVNSREYLHNYFLEKQGTNGFGLVTITRDNYREAVREYLIMGNTELEENLGTDGFGYKYLAKLVEIQNAWLRGL